MKTTQKITVSVCLALFILLLTSCGPGSIFDKTRVAKNEYDALMTSFEELQSLVELEEVTPEEAAIIEELKMQVTLIGKGISSGELENMDSKSLEAFIDTMRNAKAMINALLTTIKSTNKQES
jgi:hypothetical protein